MMTHAAATGTAAVGALLVLLAAAALVAPALVARGRLRGLASRASSGGPLGAVRAMLHRAGRSERTAVAGAALVGAVLGLILAGPVAALVCGGYPGFVVRMMLRRRHAREAEQARSEALDAVTALSDDLRAGLPPTAALGRVWPRLIGPSRDGRYPGTGTSAGPGAGRTGSVDVERAGVAPVLPDDPMVVLRHDSDPARAAVTIRLASAWQLAARTGAPLAELLERLDTELADREKVRRRALAQTAGATATAVLLALLPAAGLGLGYAIGADPLRVLLHTGIGAACAVVTLVLQVAGVLWTARLARLDGVEALT